MEGVPVSKIISASKNDPSLWIVTSLAEGENLETLYPNLDQDHKLHVVENMARLLAKIHRISVNQDLINIVYPGEKPNLDDTFTRNKKRTETTIRTLYDKGIINRDNLTKILGWYNQHADILPHGPATFVHRDYFQRNVFVNPNTLEITSVIDWGDTADIDDPIKDAVLAAWWIADNFDTDENKVIFKNFLEVYNENSNHFIDLTKIDQLLDVYNLQWYLELALHNIYTGNTKQVTSCLERTFSLVES